MIAVLFALMVAAGGAAEGSEALGRGVTLPPVELQEELKSYTQCLTQQFDALPQLRTSDGEARRLANAQAVAACAETRQSVAARADARLQHDRHYRDTKKRQAIIENSLALTDEGLVMLYLATTPAAPLPKPALSVEKAAFVYDQCLARAAADASRGNVPEADIFNIARAACTTARAILAGETGSDPRLAPTLDDIDRERAASFPERIRKLREMRQANEPHRSLQN